MGSSLVSEAVRDGLGKGLIAVGLGAVAVAILIGALQIEVISSDSRFFPCGAVFRPSPVLPDAAGVCEGTLAAQLQWMITTGSIGIAFVIVGIVLRASVPKRLQHRR